MNGPLPVWCSWHRQAWLKIEPHQSRVQYGNIHSFLQNSALSFEVIVEIFLASHTLIKPSFRFSVDFSLSFKEFLLDEITRSKGNAVDMETPLFAMTFDILGECAFSKDFQVLLRTQLPSDLIFVFLELIHENENAMNFIVFSFMTSRSLCQFPLAKDCNWTRELRVSGITGLAVICTSTEHRLGSVKCGIWCDYWCDQLLFQQISVVSFWYCVDPKVHAKSNRISVLPSYECSLLSFSLQFEKDFYSLSPLLGHLNVARG